MEKSTGVSGHFWMPWFVTRQKQEYLHRQHNMLCFILDTPHRGRYFHDCVTRSRTKVTKQVRSANPSNVPRPNRRVRRSARGSGGPHPLRRESDVLEATRKTGRHAPSGFKEGLNKSAELLRRAIDDRDSDPKSGQNDAFGEAGGLNQSVP